MDFSVGSRHYHVSLLVLLGIALGLAWWVGRGTDVSGSLERWLASGHQEVQTSGKLHTQLADSSRKIARVLARSARVAQDTAALRWNLKVAMAQTESLVRFADSARRIPLGTALQRVGEACQAQITNCEQRVGLALQALETEHGARLLLAARVGHADSIIAAGLKVADCRWLLWRCPSRTRVAEVFFVLGIGAALVVRR